MKASVRTRWRREVLRSNDITDATKLLLVVMADEMRENGYVSVPRSRLAEMLGRDERKVSARLEQAVKARLLDRVVRGNRGRTAVYRALVPGVERLPVPDTLSDGKAASSIHPFEVENRHPLTEERLPPGGPAICRETVQNTPTSGDAQRGSTSTSFKKSKKEVEVDRAATEPQALGAVLQGLFGDRQSA